MPIARGRLFEEAKNENGGGCLNDHRYLRYSDAQVRLPGVFLGCGVIGCVYMVMT